MLHWIAKSSFRLFGWRVEGRPPDIPKYVIIGAPHTSNWDFVIALTLAFIYRIKIVWMGKHTLFRWPFGALFRRLGGIPIDRRARHNRVEQAIQAFKASKQLAMVIPPEGTRKKTKYWKTGFYYIAHGAGVPIVLGFIDYKRKVAGIGPTIMPSGDIEADMKIIRNFYRQITAKYPHQVGEIAVKPREHIDPYPPQQPS